MAFENGCGKRGNARRLEIKRVRKPDVGGVRWPQKSAVGSLVAPGSAKTHV